MRGKTRASTKAVCQWMQGQPRKLKMCIASIAFLFSLFALSCFHLLYVVLLVEIVRAIGILILVYKLRKKKTCSGLSLKTQELLAVCVAVRFLVAEPANFVYDYIWRLADIVSVPSTAWVIYMMRTKLKASYMKELDTTSVLHLIVPSAMMALIAHPQEGPALICRILWSFALYLESVAVFPQLRLMQNAKMAEPFTAHYVFALGVQRFLGCAFWILRVYVTRGRCFFFSGSGPLFVTTALLAEIVQTFILVDFCYYYVQRCLMYNHLLSEIVLPV